MASDPTVSRLITALAGDADAALAAITAARAVARERVWDTAGAPLQDGRVVIDLDATLVDAHSDKQQATRTWKKGFGFHPLLGYINHGYIDHGGIAHRGDHGGDHGVGGGGEPAAELLRPGKSGSSTAVDHIAVFDAALAQVPAALRRRDEHGSVPVLVRTDAAGATKEFAAHSAGVKGTVRPFGLPPLLREVVQECVEAGLVRGEERFFDATKVEANASMRAGSPGSRPRPTWASSSGARRCPRTKRKACWIFSARHSFHRRRLI